MQHLPHHYTVKASGGAQGDLALGGPGLPTFAVAAPPEFDGPGDRWSPETLIAGTVATCLILTFRSVAAASKLEWTSLDCDCVATLDRVDKVRRFHQYDLKVTLRVPAGTDVERARRLVEKAESVCLITSSLNGTTQLETQVEQVAAGASA